MIGGTVIQTFILAWVTFRTDWTKEVRRRYASKIVIYIFIDLIVLLKNNCIFMFVLGGRSFQKVGKMEQQETRSCSRMMKSL